MGVSYDFVELYTEWLQLPESQKSELLSKLSKESLAYFKDKAAKVETIHRRNRHKLVYPINLDVYNSTLELKPTAKL
jgi:hypothetical protein